MRAVFQIVFLWTVVFLVAVPGCDDSSSKSKDTETDSDTSATDNPTDTGSSNPTDTGTSTDTEDTGDTDTGDNDTSDTEDSDTGDGGVDDTDIEGPSMWGWISAIEWNDTCDQWDLITDWTGGVRAYFAERSSYPRALPHHLDFIPETAAEGSCRLYTAGILANCEFQDDCFMCVDGNFECWRVCGEDQECQKGDAENPEGICTDLPEHWNLGTITLSGFKEPITLKPGEHDLYYTAAKLTSRNDLFDDGDVLTATTEGGALSPLTFSTKGTAPLELSNNTVELTEDASATVSWTPADDDSRIQIALTGGSHDPNPLTAMILCDVEDSRGSLEIPANLVNGFLAESCPGALFKCSRITRYNRDVIEREGKELELFVGSAQKLLIELD